MEFMDVSMPLMKRIENLRVSKAMIQRVLDVNPQDRGAEKTLRFLIDYENNLLDELAGIVSNEEIESEE